MFYLCPIAVAIRLKGCQLILSSWLLRQQQTLIKKEIDYCLLNIYRLVRGRRHYGQN
jgi:hypothetical protein